MDGIFSGMVVDAHGGDVERPIGCPAGGGNGLQRCTVAFVGEWGGTSPSGGRTVYRFVVAAKVHQVGSPHVVTRRRQSAGSMGWNCRLLTACAKHLRAWDMALPMVGTAQLKEIVQYNRAFFSPYTAQLLRLVVALRLGSTLITGPATPV